MAFCALHFQKPTNYTAAQCERTTVNISDSLSRTGFGNKAKIATVDKQTVDQSSLIENPTAVVRYQLDNHLGSASLELDESADIISYEEYHPFGTTSYRSGRTETETSQKRYKYVGKERDEETGLYYYGFRYYAAWICRFVSVDPLQFEYPYYTPFQYAGNKPIIAIDLDGLESQNVVQDDEIGQQKAGAPVLYPIAPNAPISPGIGIGIGILALSSNIMADGTVQEYDEKYELDLSAFQVMKGWHYEQGPTYSRYLKYIWEINTNPIYKEIEMLRKPKLQYEAADISLDQLKEYAK